MNKVARFTATVLTTVLVFSNSVLADPAASGSSVSQNQSIGTQNQSADTQNQSRSQNQGSNTQNQNVNP